MVGRRLAAILAADIAGYSALMGSSDVETVVDLKGHQSAVLPMINGYGGRIIDTAGDGILAEFPSVFNAVKCAIAIQEVMRERNASVAPERRMQFRIGVNQGDVLHDEHRIYGDGINIAARLENICEPGGICISGKVYEEVKGRFEIAYDDIGEQSLKNIAEPVHAYRISVSGVPGKRPSKAAATSLPASRRWTAALAGLLAAAAAGGLWWWQRPAAPPGLGAALAGALQTVIGNAPADHRQRQLDGYVAARAHKALAVAPVAQRTWWTSEWPSPALATEKALERCHLSYGEPCAVLAADEVVHRPEPPAGLAVREAPRVVYNGPFLTERIPAIARSVELRMDVAGYATAPEPKAIAIHASGALHVVTGAATQREAEERALRACNDDPLRARTGGPCLVYAVANQVMLPLRSTGAISPLPRPETREALLQALAAAAPRYTHREEQVRSYLGSPTNRALAVQPPDHSWRVSGFETAAQAEERAREGCEVRYGAPCLVLAVNDLLRAVKIEPGGQLTARVGYEGLFDPAQIPTASTALRQRPDVLGYRQAAGHKAAALHPWGRLFVVTGSISVRAAETESLAQCNGDPARAGRDGPCLLYATGNAVVLKQRLTAPSTPP
jgi:class 3 adenylate cyclase